MSVSLEFDGHDELRRIVERMGNNGSSLDVPLRAFGAHMQTIPMRSVREQQAPATGKRFPKLSGLTSSLRGRGKRLADTSRLMRSFLGAPRVTRSSASVSSNLVHAGIHQDGGVIRPRVARFLTVPLTKKAKRAKSARRWFEAEKRAGRKPFFARSKKGNLLAFSRLRTNSRKIVPHWLLMNRIEIPGTGYLGFKDSDADVLADLLTAHLQEGTA